MKIQMMKTRFIFICILSSKWHRCKKFVGNGKSSLQKSTHAAVWAFGMVRFEMVYKGGQRTDLKICGLSCAKRRKDDNACWKKLLRNTLTLSGKNGYRRVNKAADIPCLENQLVIM